MTFLDALLGPRCSCGQRVFPKDAADHVCQTAEAED